MASKKKTWVWILVASFGLMILAMAAVVGMGLYFVTSHVSVGRQSSARAIEAFDEVRLQFRDEKPLLEVDNDDLPRATRDLAELPTSSRRVQDLWILAWDPDRERLSKISLPFWVLRLGHRNIRIQNESGFRLEELHLDFDQLERVGPILVFDYRKSDGERVLVWTR